ncbi:MAG: hypothetical protein RMK98_08205 [Bacteroidia bacterium]|nr:hypothetical protein [Bacteroidia bacterium]
MSKISSWLYLAGVLMGWAYSQSTCKQLIPKCRDESMQDYSWDGRYWRAELYNNETSKFYCTFFSGLRYRLIPCGYSSTQQRPNLRIYNANSVLILDTGKQSETNRNYWDLELSTTQLFLLELYYTSGEGCATLLIGHRTPQ